MNQCQNVDFGFGYFVEKPIVLNNELSDLGIRRFFDLVASVAQLGQGRRRGEAVLQESLSGWS